MSDPQKAAIDVYLEQLAGLAARQTDIERKIGRLEKAVRAIIDLLDDEGEQLKYLERLDDTLRPAGLTDAIREFLKINKGKPISPTGVAGWVRQYTVNHSNPLASVHTVLKRLAKTDEFEAVTVDGKPHYRWISSDEYWDRLAGLKTSTYEGKDKQKKARAK